MNRYRKKPVVIEAAQFSGTPESAGQILAWGESGCITYTSDGWGGVAYLAISTLEGVMRADPGDWIIRGVAGEFYPCKPDIFVKTYEPVEPAK
jgi:hypothetical protein